MSIDLSSVQVEDKDFGSFRCGVDPEKTAQLLELMAANIRDGIVHPQKVVISSTFESEEWERGILHFEFSEKVMS